MSEMHRSAMPETLHRVDDPDQIEALASSTRQEIVDTVVASGPCTVSEIATELGRPSDGLYYHLRRLVDVGLLEQGQRRGASGKLQAFYDVPASEGVELSYDAEDPENVEGVSQVISAMLRVADRDFRAGFRPDLAETEGPGRNLWGLRVKGWLTEAETRRANRLLTELVNLLHGGRRRPDAQLLGLTWVLAPIDPQPTYRAGPTDADAR